MKVLRWMLVPTAPQTTPEDYPDAKVLRAWRRLKAIEDEKRRAKLRFGS